MLLEDIMFIKLAIWNTFVGEVFVCEQETQTKASILLRVAFIAIVVTCIVATNQRWLLLKVQSLMK